MNVSIRSDNSIYCLLRALAAIALALLTSLAQAEVTLPTPNLIVRYTVSGEPLFFGEPGADFDQDDDIDSDDLVAFFATWDEGDIAADTDADQDTDSEDLVLFIQWFENGVGQTGTSVGSLRFAFRGYWWDPYLKVYHVRHRVYDPTPGPGGLRWLQRDPAGFVDGWNLYAYCPEPWGGGDPVNGIDPYGLDGWWIGWIARSVGAPEVGDYLDDSVDGAAEIGGYWSAIESAQQILDDASDPEARKEVHNALQKAKDVSSSVPVAGDLAYHAVNIVDAGLSVWDEHVDGSGTTTTGGITVVSPAIDNFVLAVAEGVGGSSKAGKNGSDPFGNAASGKKRGPKTSPGEGQNPKIAAKEAERTAMGHEHIAGGSKDEKLWPTLGGEKSGRRPDLLMKDNDGKPYGIQVGKTDKNGNPVKREKDSLNDLNIHGNLPTEFCPYDR